MFDKIAGFATSAFLHSMAILMMVYGGQPAAIHIDQIIYKNSKEPVQRLRLPDDEIRSASSEPLAGIVSSIAAEEPLEAQGDVESLFIPFEVLVCDTVDRSIRLAETITSVGSIESRYSIAYDAYMADYHCLIQYDIKIERAPLYLKSAEGSGRVAVVRVVECGQCTEELDPSSLFAILLTEDVFNNVFRCQRDDRQYSENGFDTSLRCRQDT